MKKTIFISLGLALMAGAAAWASNTGSISGLVTDPTGAVIPGVTVKAVNTSTAVERSATTNAEGFYALPNLSVGTYDVTFTKEGFKEFRQTGLAVDVNANLRVDASLVVGGAKEEVTVTSAPVIVETQRTEMGEVIGGAHMTALPLDGRSFTDLLALQPGVVPISTGEYSSQSPSGSLNSGNLSVSGQREDANGFMVNGGNVEEGGSNGTAVVPNLDSIAEFRIQTHNFDAEYGNYSGGLIQVATKQGTNQYHGDVFEFLRNQKMDARNFYSYDQTDPITGAVIPGSARAALHRNQFGGTFGGPILHDKVFFFADYQGTREVQGQPDLVLVPSSNQRSGIFDPVGDFTCGQATDPTTGAGLVDSSGNPLPNPCTVTGPFWATTLGGKLGYSVSAGEAYAYNIQQTGPTTGNIVSCTSSASCVFPNGTIPTSIFSAPAQALLSGGYIPPANTGAFFSTSKFKSTLRDDKWAYRTDANTRWGMFSEYYHFDDFYAVNPFGGGNLPGFSSVVPGRAQQLNLGYTKSGPTLVNEVRLNYMRYAFWSGEPNGGIGSKLTDFGITGVFPVAPGLQGVPNVATNEFSMGVFPWSEKQVNNTYQMIDNFSKVYGTHTEKFGGEVHVHQINLFDHSGGNGVWSFSGSETGSDFADFLLGAVSTYLQGEQLPEYTRTWYYSLYAQDSWRPRPALTVNYGMRWEVSTPWYEKNNELETLVSGIQSKAFPGAPLGWVIPTDPTVPHTVAPIRYNNFGPRVGLAYSPSSDNGISKWVFGGANKSSIRASFGIFYTAFEDATSFNAVGDAPFGYFYVNPEETFFDNPFINLPDGTNNGQRFPAQVPPLNVSPSNPDSTINWSLFEPISSSPGFDHTNRVPYAEHYTISYERQITPNTLFSLSYVGGQGHRLLALQEANPGNPALCLSVSQTSQVTDSVTCGPFGENGVYHPITGGVINSTRGPFGPAFGSDGLFSTAANSNYNALEVSLRHSSSRAQVLVGYTYGKSLDNASSWGPGSGSGGVEMINPVNAKLGKSLSAFDLTHNFVASFAYELPLEKYLPANRATRGWMLTGITRFTTGLPVFITEQDDNSLLGTFCTGPTCSDVDTPNFTPGSLAFRNPRKQDLNALNPQTAYFNVSLFSPEQLGQLGNANRRFFHGPGINNWDLGILKDLKLTESKSLQFRGEFFSVFNHAQFGNPDGNISDSAFGFITGAGGERIGQVAIKLYF